MVTNQTREAWNPYAVAGKILKNICDRKQSVDPVLYVRSAANAEIGNGKGTIWFTILAELIMRTDKIAESIASPEDVKIRKKFCGIDM